MHRDTLTPDQLAARWKMTEKTLANERALGIGPDYIRISARRVVYPLDAVLAWEECRRVRVSGAALAREA